MTCVKTLLLAFVALSFTLMTVAQAAQPTISHNAAVRRHAAIIHDRPARRSVEVGDGRMMVQKRQTAEQIAQAAALKKWDDDFHAKNAEWQQAAMAALAQGQTPPSYDEYWNGKSGDSSSSSSSSSPASSSPALPSTSTSDSGTSDNSSSDQSSAAPAPAQQQQDDVTKPAQQQQQEAAQQPTAQPSQPNAGAGTATTESTSTQENSGSDSDDCTEDDSSNDSTPANGTAAAAASGSKNNAAQSQNSNGSSSSSQATSGHFDGQATYYAPGLGACGWTNSDSDYIVAISASLFDSFGTGNPNNNPACGHKIAATYGGKTITVSVADRCVGCKWGDLDFTPGAFSSLADMSLGRLNGLSWSWIGAAPK